MDEKRFQELHEKYGNLIDGDCPSERREYVHERLRRIYEEEQRKIAEKETLK